jgi:hypothetical protein
LPQGTERERKLLALLLACFCIALALLLLGVKPFKYGLSTVMGTSLLTVSSGESIVVFSLFRGLDINAALSDALTDAQIMVTLLGISLLAYAEVANPTYGGNAEFLRELRRNWMPILAIVLLLFTVTVASRVLLLVP